MINKLLYYVKSHVNNITSCSEREKQMAKLTERKYSYTVGQWNVNTVTMGGLGKDPDLTAEVEQTGQCTYNVFMDMF